MPEVPKGLTKDQMREVIRRERRIELTFEGLYYSDILRWKTAEKENNGMMHNYDGIEVVKLLQIRVQDCLVIRDRP